MKDELRSEAQAEMWRGGKIRKSPFFYPTYLSAILSVVSMNQVEAGRPKTAAMKSEKSEKWFFAIFQLESAAVQSIATETDLWISRIFREFLRGVYGGGRGQ